MNSEFRYVGIRVKDLERPVDFYTRLFGMKIVGRGKIQKTRGETVALQDRKSGFTLELNHYEKNSPHSTPYIVGEGLDHLAFKVDDLEKALAEARRLGHEMTLEIKEGSGRWVYIEDPNGIWIELF